MFTAQTIGLHCIYVSLHACHAIQHHTLQYIATIQLRICIKQQSTSSRGARRRGVLTFRRHIQLHKDRIPRHRHPRRHPRDPHEDVGVVECGLLYAIVCVGENVRHCRRNVLSAKRPYSDVGTVQSVVMVCTVHRRRADGAAAVVMFLRTINRTCNIALYTAMMVHVRVCMYSVDRRPSGQRSGQFLLRPGARQSGGRRGRRRAVAMRRVEPAVHRVLLDARRPRARQHQPPLPGRDRPAHTVRQPVARRRVVPVRRRQRVDRDRRAQRPGTAHRLL